jgi:hypothetical protein
VSATPTAETRVAPPTGRVGGRRFVPPPAAPTAKPEAAPPPKPAAPSKPYDPLAPPTDRHGD